MIPPVHGLLHNPAGNEKPSFGAEMNIKGANKVVRKDG